MVFRAGSGRARAIRVAGALAAGALVLSACGSTSSAAAPKTTAVPSAQARHGGVLTMAEGEQGNPDSILPWIEAQYNSVANAGSFQNFMWPALYTFGTPSSLLGLNNQLSLAYAPVASDNDSIYTVRLKSWKWSDGTPLTSRDVTFFMNLLDANKTLWAHYVVGEMPDNVAKVTTDGPHVVVFHLKRSYNPQWFLDDQLAEIIPMPQQAWDKTSSSSPDGNYDETPSGARAVLAYLSAQSKQTTTYASNPLWKVVDGPWKLTSFNINGAATFVANRTYSGPDKPYLSEFKEVPYTSDAAEFSSVLAGDQLQVGYLPPNDFALSSRVVASGYRVAEASNAQINFMVMNYNSPTAGPIFRQLYVRQALQHLMNQTGVIDSALDRTGGYPDYGPIPPQPPSAYLSPVQKTNPYPYSPSDARRLLVSHGWRIPKSGAATCTRPGTASDDCGAGIARGQSLSFSLLYISGVSYLQVEMEDFESAASTVGIEITPKTAPFYSVISEVLPCGKATCTGPDLGNWGDGFSWDFGTAYPSGGEIFGSHEYVGFPTTATLTRLIAATHYTTAAGAPAAMRAYDAYLTKQLPAIFQPETFYEYAVSTGVGGVYFPATGLLSPQNWFYKR
jgi:peptide/nickel transport system substrate-binding protein